MPTPLRRVIANGIASVAVALGLLMSVGAGGALATAEPAVHAGAIGGVVMPSIASSAGPTGVSSAGPTGVSSAATRTAASETFGGSASGSAATGTSPGGGTPPLLYGGGPVMHGVTTRVLAWAPASDPFPSGYVSGYEQYLADMRTALGLSSNISSVAAQYVDAGGSALSALTNDAAIYDSDAYPTSGGCSVSGASVCLTEYQILTELAGVISADALPIDESHSYIVLLPPGVDTCFTSSSSSCETQAFCGYHTAFSVGSAIATFTLLPYTESSYGNSAGTCGVSDGPAGLSPAVSALDSIGAHELFESATDPLVGSGYIDSTGEEVGDECAWTWGSYSAASGGGYYNQLVNGDQYLIQEMWSNQAGACVLGAASTARATISQSGSASVNAPSSFSVALSGDSSAASSYEWSYESPRGSVSSDVSTAASPSLTFTSAGTYTVWAQVTDASGGTVTAVTDVTATIARPPVASFGYSTTTSVPANGSAVSFTSSSTASSSQSITATSWSFGDGATGSGATASHTYAGAGSYTVTMRVTQTDGQSSSSSRTVTVANPPTASIGSSSSTPTAAVALTFSSGAAAGAGSITSYSWNFGDGSGSSSARPSHAYAAAGRYTVTLTVTQTDGLQSTVTTAITVVAPAVPTASFSYYTSAATPTSGTAISFRSAATAGSGAITAYRWSFGDGGTSTSADPSHTYMSAGTYTVTLAVTQSDGLTTTAAEAITIAQAARTKSSATHTSSGSTSIRWSRPSSWLLQSIQAADSSTTKIVSLLRSNGSRTILSAPQVSGELVITWRASVNHHSTVIASSKGYVLAGVTPNATIKLTRAGRKLLARRRLVRVSAQATFRSGTSASRTTRKLTLRR